MLASDRELPVSGGPGKAGLCPGRLHRHRAHLRSPQPHHQPALRSGLAAIRGRTAWVGSGSRRESTSTSAPARSTSRPPWRGGRDSGGGSSAPTSCRRCSSSGANKAAGLAPVTADALELPFPDAAFDGAMVGWGVRNLVDLDAGLAEAARVLRPGGRLVILEMTLPPQPGAPPAVRVLLPARDAVDRPADLETYDRLYLVTSIHDRVPRARPSWRGGSRRRDSTGCPIACSWAASVRCTWGPDVGRETSPTGDGGG